MTATEKPVDASPPPALKKGLALLCRHHGDGAGGRHAAVALVVPMLGLSTAQSALLAGVLLAGGPEVLCILAVALLGKDTFRYFTHRVMTALRRAVIDQPASKARYYTASRHSAELASSLHLRVLPTSCRAAMRAFTFSPPWIWRSSSASFSWARNSGKRSGASSSTKAGFEFGAVGSIAKHAR